ncbi:GNAT family N-acetyltransferase [Antribacter gilvus]|uniref:GNAT family N-acetyltransferase n=1 Tax=Antribacter gilvus TaxID=2304675 RepID=UPI001F0C4AB2|nr:GNAT family N-acetyltransferase [Antribacter gilvus]
MNDLSPYGHHLTERLALRAVTLDDLEVLHALHADPAVWEHFPSGRHETVERTRADVERFVAGWEANGLGYWTAWRRDTGDFVGVGGVSVRLGVAWNVYYRLSPAQQGQGFAREVASAAVAAGQVVRPDLPVTAFLLEHNGASRAVAEKSGLQVVWRGPDVGNPDPAAVRLVLADRPVETETLTTLVTHA